MSRVLCFAAGAALCRAITVILEWMYHRSVLHATNHRVQRWRSCPRLLGFVRLSWAAHRAHHARALHACRASQARALEVARKDLAVLRGTRLDVVLAALPVAAVPPAVYLLGNAGLLGALLAATYQLWVVWVLHPYLHLPHDETQAIAGPLLAWLLRHTWLRRAADHHRAHHRAKRGNFTFFGTGDWLLGTRMQLPSDGKVRHARDS